MENSIELLINYLRDILYDTSSAQLKINELHENCKKLGEGMQYVAECLLEVQELSKALSRGDLNVTLPSRQNELAAPLKSLHASLKHMTWQSQQVAKGDYQQRIDFMGEFSDAFNSMTKQLDQRQKALEAEVEISRRKSFVLEQSNNLFEIITTETSLWIFVVCAKTKKLLFANKAAETALAPSLEAAKPLRTWLETVEYCDFIRPGEIKLKIHKGELVCSVQAYRMHLWQEEVITYVLRDVTYEKQEVRRLETAAHIDSLTHLYNRYFGMENLHKWLEEGQTFSLCFVDIDYLKYVNDNFGHTEGDFYIQSVGAALFNSFPDSIVSRLGGDEFMVLLPNLNAEEAERRFFLLREKLRENRPSDDEYDYKLSISYGIVEVSQRNSLEASDLLGLADERMYHFKRAHKAQRSVSVL